MSDDATRREKCLKLALDLIRAQVKPEEYVDAAQVFYGYIYGASISLPVSTAAFPAEEQS